MNRVIPTAAVEFADGHTEESIIVFPISDRDFIAVTESGAYRPEALCGHYILEYHPELIKGMIFMNHVAYEFDTCWIASDKAVKMNMVFVEEGE